MHTAELMSSQQDRTEIPGATIQLVASIRRSVGNDFILAGDSREISARKAASCLLQPNCGDRVLAVVSGNEAWIVAVLERHESQMHIVETEGPIHLRSRSGSVTIEALESVRLKGMAGVEVDSPRFALRTGLMELVAGKFQWVCDKVDGRFNTARVAGTALDRIVKRFTSRTRFSSREVETVDRVRSGEIDYRADNNYVFRGRNILGKASDLAKMDADQIHMG